MDYITFGEGKKNFVIIPGLSVHGVIGMADSIREAYKIFSKDYTVYLFDRSEKLPENITIRELAADTAAAMKKLHIEKACVFGASMGGMIAQYLAIDHPELVSGMILGSTLSRPNKTFNKLVNKWISLAENKEEEKLIEEFINNVYSEKTLRDYRDILIASNFGITDDEYKRFIISAKACLDFNCYEKLSQIKCPVLVLGARGDKVVTTEASTEISDALKCEVYLYDESYGHGVYDEAFDYKQRCMDFLKKHSL